jgi:hypothetical protein
MPFNILFPAALSALLIVSKCWRWCWLQIYGLIKIVGRLLGIVRYNAILLFCLADNLILGFRWLNGFAYCHLQSIFKGDTGFANRYFAFLRALLLVFRRDAFVTRASNFRLFYTEEWSAANCDLF